MAIQKISKLLASGNPPRRCGTCGSTAVTALKFNHRCGLRGGTPQPPVLPANPGPGKCPTCGHKQTFFAVYVCHNCRKTVTVKL